MVNSENKEPESNHILLDDVHRCARRTRGWMRRCKSWADEDEDAGGFYRRYLSLSYRKLRPALFALREWTILADDSMYDYGPLTHKQRWAFEHVYDACRSKDRAAILAAKAESKNAFNLPDRTLIVKLKIDPAKHDLIAGNMIDKLPGAREPREIYNWLANVSDVPGHHDSRH